MADELAKVLTIPDSVTQKMDDVIEKITEIESASNKMATTVNQAWKQLANGDIDTYLKKLQDVADATQSKKISIDTTDITKAASEAERWAAALTLVATQAANYAATKTANYAIRQEWDEALKAMKAYEEAKYKAMEMGTSVSPEAQASNAAILKRLEELRKAYPELARLKDATWDATKEKLYIQHLERIDKKNQQIEDREARQAHNREIRAKQVEAANTRVLILAEKLSRESGKSQHYAGLLAELQRLQEEYKKLGNSKEDAERRGQLEQEMQQVRDSIQQADGQMRRLSNTTRGLFNYSQQLSRAFALLFSVSQIRQYIRQIREVTAEFELQKVALGSLLQSQEKANELFGQITNLAVRSPFTIKELNTYTKQLAAYNIQYESLFDTTKMLADVSAGLGVDIGRLILAFGQVKAATVLRGTEVRQFTEAGFGILNELATYYTELEGRLVSVGDVQDRITKRMVKFADVEEIFKRVTSAGGMFYNMQEKMAETLYGRWSNLTDRIDLMLNEIGQNNKGFFNLLISLASGLAENWEAVAVALQLAIPALISFKVQSAMAAKGLTWIGQQSIFASISLRGLGAAFKSALGPVGLLILAFEAGYAIFNRLADATERNNKAIEDYNRNIAVVVKATKAFDDIAKTAKNTNETDEAFAKRQYSAKLKSLSELRRELESIGFDQQYLPDMSVVTPENIDEQVANLQKSAKAYADFSYQFRGIVGSMADGVEWLGLLGENIKTDAEDLVKSASKMNASVTTDVENIKNAFTAIQDKIDPDTFNELFAGLTQKDGEDAITYAERLKSVLEELSKPYSPLTRSLGMDAKYVKQWASDALDAVEGFQSDIKEMEYEADALAKRMMENYYGSKEKMRQVAEVNPIEFEMAVRDELAREQIDGLAQDIAAKQIFAYVDVIPQWSLFNNGNNQLAQWKQALLNMPELEGLVTDEDLKNVESFEAYISSLQRETKKAKEENEKYGKTIENNKGVAAEQLKETIDRNKETITTNEAIAKALGINLNLTKEEQKQAKTRNDYLKESISLIQKMGKEYDEALKYMGEKAATTDISTRYSSLLTDLASKAGMDTGFIADLTFNTEGIIAGLKKIADAAAKAGATEAEETAREAIAKLEGDKVKLTAEIDIDTLENEIDDFFSKYNMGKELSKLGLGKELTSSLFNFEFVDLDDARDYLEKWRKQHLDTNGNLGKDYQEAYNKAQREITEAERKELDERIKMYHKYLKQSMSDAVAVKLEEARQLADIQKMAIDESYKAQLREGVKRDTAEKYDKAKWEEFKNTDMYIRMFEDLDYMSTASLNRLKDKLIEVKGSLHNLSPENIKEIQSRFEEIDEVIRQRSPFKQLAKDMRAIKDLEAAGETREVLEAQMAQAEVQMSANQQEIEFLEKYIGLKQQGLSLDNLTAEERAKIAQYEEYGIELAEVDLDIAKGMYSYYEKIFGTASGKVTLWKDLGKDLEASKTKLQTWREVWGRVADTASEALEMMGAEADGIGQTFIALGSTLFDIGLATVQQAINFKAMGIAANSSLGIIGWIAIALQTVVSLMSALFKMHDNRLENQIERELELIDELQKKYEKLEEAIENAYSMDTYDRAQYQAEKNLEAQNEALNRAMAAEEDKKKTDSDRIKEWQEQYEENLKKIAELRQNAIEAYGGFGTSDNIKSAAEDFVSAWLNAFNETGKGLDGLSEQMDEWLNNAIQRQLLMRLSDQFITPLLNQFDAMFSETSSGGRIMTKEEIDAWKNLYEQNSKEFDEKAKAYLEALNIKPTGTESELSGLQRGIEGVTETTAQALEALLNSIRYYVSDTNGLIRQLYASFMSPDEAINPMLYELKQHTTLLNAIHSLLYSTTKTTNNNGRALKVLMM